MYVLTGPTACKPPGPERCRNTGTEVFLFLPAVVVSPSSLFLCLVVVVSVF